MEEKVSSALSLALKAYDPENQAGAEVIDDRVTGVQCFIRRRGDTLTVAFRGSDSKKDWQTNLAFGLQPVPWEVSSGSRVHRGFAEAYRMPQIRLRIQSLILPGVRRVTVCGHSLGAALAVLCAADVKKNYPTVSVEAYLFGCPRVGNRAFCREYDRAVSHTLRVENGNDIVTKLPLRIMGYRHVGKVFRIGVKRWPVIVSVNDHRPENYVKEMKKALPVSTGRAGRDR